MTEEYQHYGKSCKVFGSMCPISLTHLALKEFRSSGVQEFRSSGVQEFRSSGVQREWTSKIARKSGA